MPRVKGTIQTRTLQSPIGPVTVTVEDGAVTGLDFADHGGRDDGPLLKEAERQVAAYFAGRLKAFDLPVALRGTAFQRRVWAAMREIPWGEVASYGGIAMVVGTGPRAVGNACGRNPVSLLVPCHRVLASGGGPGGYGATGLGVKRWLLRHEGRTVPW
ncbi:MAG TPA: methylated-DNA--[protein]-cysteine S-methyltransferase [Alphaproteobacteria bacterium]|nr:methylated-DNA--[protein]-cysteine S-methyltransferase [Alphaproteobacteria bacterium]